jgi:hypothetical protein
MKTQTMMLLLAGPLFLAHSDTRAEEKIPYPAALADAAIQVDRLTDISEYSLIIGNGDVNALIYTDNTSILLNLTKNDVWDARLETVNDPPLPTLDLIKQLGQSATAFPLKNSNSGYVLPEGVSWNAVDSYHAGAYPCPRQCARIKIQLSPAAQPGRGEIDLKRAVARVFAGKSAAEIRALADRNAFLIQTSGTLHLETVVSQGLPPAETGTTNGVDWLRQQIPGDLDWPGMAFAVAVAARDGWNSVVIVSSREATDVVKTAVEQAHETLNYKTAKLIQNHEKTWAQFWSRSGLVLKDALLQCNWYRALYFLRCVSRPGVQSVGLFAGLINDTPAWHGDYHTNYNLQQTYWTALAANHPDLCEPYDRLMSEYLPRAKWLSQKVFSLNGAYYPHVLFANEPPNPAECRSRHGRQYLHHTWGMTIGVNGFSVQPIWWRYKYDPDPERLRQLVYPVVRDVALFYAEFIEQCPDTGSVRLGPSVSPEHWGWTKNLDRNYDCAFDIALIRYTLNAAIEAAEILKQDEPLIQRFRNARQRLPDYPETATNPPILVDVAGAPPIEYNIPVPSTPVFPGDVISWWSMEHEKQRFSRTIDSLRWNGNNATFMLAIARARLSLPGTQAWLRHEILARSRANGTLALNILVPPQRFNDFGHYTEQFGVGLAISELLVQSVDDIIRVFPALAPDETAACTNLRTQGGFLVTASGSSGMVKTLQIHSLFGGRLRLSSPWLAIQARARGKSSFQPLEKDGRGIVEIVTQPGELWEFRGN